MFSSAKRLSPCIKAILMLGATVCLNVPCDNPEIPGENHRQLFWKSVWLIRRWIPTAPTEDGTPNPIKVAVVHFVRTALHYSTLVPWPEWSLGGLKDDSCCLGPPSLSLVCGSKQVRHAGWCGQTSQACVASLLPVGVPGGQPGPWSCCGRTRPSCAQGRRYRSTFSGTWSRRPGFSSLLRPAIQYTIYTQLKAHLPFSVPHVNCFRCCCFYSYNPISSRLTVWPLQFVHEVTAESWN